MFRRKRKKKKPDERRKAVRKSRLCGLCPLSAELPKLKKTEKEK